MVSSPVRPDVPTFDDLAACVHCGLCLEACPTYRELRVEMDSPRGRLYLMKGLLDERLAPTADVLTHLDRCLDCRACETACPSGVQYGSILERSRAWLEPRRTRSRGVYLLRGFLFDTLLPSRHAQQAMFAVLWLAQTLGITALGGWLGRHGLLSARVAAAAAQAPTIPLRSFRGKSWRAFDRTIGRYVFRAAQGKGRFRVALFTGCVADRLFPGVSEAAVKVLTMNGCDVEVLEREQCCGALHIHNGAREQAKPLARANVSAFEPENYDAIVTSSAGCGAELRHYDKLLPGDDRAVRFAGKVRDITEFLMEIESAPPTARLAGRVAYDEPCHLLHAQGVSSAPKGLLDGIRGLEIVPLEDADTCCGSAGIYSFTEPELSQAVLGKKIESIKRSGATIVTTGNPGCLLQIRAGLAQAGLPVDVVHPIELLARAYD